MKKERDAKEVSEAIRVMCQTNLGVLDKGFLCQSLSVLNAKIPHSLKKSATIKEVLTALQTKKIGCVIIVDDKEKVAGIFSERDFLLKVAHLYEAIKNDPVENYMTADPVTQPPEGTIAYALNLMSQGGFRHIPIVDGENKPVGMISVKDVVDYIVETFTQDLLDFPLA